MPINAELFAADTSVAVAALDRTHAAHAACLAAVIRHRPLLAGHAAWETFSVLTRMPGELAIDGPTASAAVVRMFPTIAWLSEANSAALFAPLGVRGIVGGAVYDALVGEAARSNGLTLLTRDLRARRTYDLLGINHRFVDWAPDELRGRGHR